MSAFTAFAAAPCAARLSIPARRAYSVVRASPADKAGDAFNSAKSATKDAGNQARGFVWCCRHSRGSSFARLLPSSCAPRRA